MVKSAQIVLRIKRIDDLFLNPDILNDQRILNKDAEGFIVEQAEAVSWRLPITTIIHVTETKPSANNDIAEAIHQHFRYCTKKSKKQLRHTLNLGLRSLGVGFLFLTVIFFLTRTLVRAFPEGGIVITFRELFIILAWVGLWRPAELLLYEWYPHQRNARLFDRLANCKVEVVNE